MWALNPKPCELQKRTGLGPAQGSGNEPLRATVPAAFKEGLHESAHSRGHNVLFVLQQANHWFGSSSFELGRSCLRSLADKKNTVYKQKKPAKQILRQHYRPIVPFVLAFMFRCCGVPGCSSKPESVEHPYSPWQQHKSVSRPRRQKYKSKSKAPTVRLLPDSKVTSRHPEAPEAVKQQLQRSVNTGLLQDASAVTWIRSVLVWQHNHSLSV